MIETILPAFLLGWILGAGWWLIIVLAFAALFVEHSERHGWTLFFSTLLLLVCVVVFDPSTKILALGAVCYLPIGFMWSFFRWNRRCTDAVRRFKDMAEKSVADYEKNRRHKSNTIEFWGHGSHEQTLKSRVNFKENVDVIVAWIIAWPFSIVAVFCSDLIYTIEHIVRGAVSKTYVKMSVNAEQQMEELQEKSREQKREIDSRN